MAAPWSSTGLVTANALASYWSGQITLCGKATSSSPTQTETTYTIPSVKIASVLQSSSSTKTPSVLSVNDDGIEISLRVNNENKLTYTGKSITGTKTGSLTFNKTHSAQTINLKLYYDFAGAISVYITDSTGPRSESQGGSWSVVSDTYTVTVPAKTSYTVTYSANGGVNPPPNATKWYGETLTLSTSRVNPSRTNYEFWHWNTKSDNTGTSYGIGGSYTANAAATLYAIWNPIISYNANGGTNAPASQTKTYGTDLTLSSGKPTRTGLTFAGWGTSSTATTVAYAAGGKYTSNSAATLYAVWKYTVSFNGNGNGVNPTAQTAVYGYNVTIAGYPTRSGYRFLGWNSAQDGTGTHYAPGTSVAVNENCTLYAQWRKVTVSSVKVTRNVRAVGFTSTWSCSSTVGGTVTVTAQYSLDDGANWHDCTLTGDATKTKVAGTDLSGIVTWASTADEDVAVRVMVTASFTDTYSSTSISGGHVETAQRGGTIPKEFRLFDALHGGTGLAIGTIATLASTLEVGLTSLLNGVVMVMQGNLTRDGQNTVAANGDHPIQFVDSSQRQMSYIVTHKTNNSTNNYLRLTAIGPSGSKTANLYLSASDTAGYLSTDVDVMTLKSLKSMARGVSYIQGANGNAALYAPKSTTNQYYPAVCLETNGGGSWSIGNYNDEALEFVYATKANRDSNTNTVSVMKLNSGAGTIYTTTHKPSATDVGALPIGGGTLTGKLTVSSGGIAINGGGLAVHGNTMEMVPGVNRDGSNPSSDVWSNGMGFGDKDGEWLGYLQAYQLTNGTSGIQLRATAENSSGSEVQNFIRIAVDKSGNKAYSVGDAAAFRSAIGAQAAGSYATTNASGAINTLASTSTQQWYVKGTVSNSSNTARNGHTTWLVMNNGSCGCWDATAGATLWNTYTTANKPTPADIGAIDDVTTSSKTVSLPASKSAVSVTAPTVTGYTFVCWLQPAGSGHTNPAYMENASAATTNLYSSNGTTTAARSWKCTALYKK